MSYEYLQRTRVARRELAQMQIMSKQTQRIADLELAVDVLERQNEALRRDLASTQRAKFTVREIHQLEPNDVRRLLQIVRTWNTPEGLYVEVR